MIAILAKHLTLHTSTQKSTAQALDLGIMRRYNSACRNEGSNYSTEPFYSVLVYGRLIATELALVELIRMQMK